MEFPPSCLSWAAPAHDSIATEEEKEKEKEEEEEEKEEGQLSHVDPFLVEAIENPRHRLTVLRMELDIQRFMQNSDQHQFEFQNLPTSYLRCVAHRVAQHYGLQTMALDYTVDGLGSRIVARKTPESKYPVICLSDIPLKQPENDKIEKVKIAIRPRPNKPSPGDAIQLEIRRNPVRTVEEREEEYDKARARIFSGSWNSEVEGPSSTVAADDKSSLCSSTDGQECYRTVIEENENISTRDGASRVAIFRDREKDRTDPDYDRSYDRYAKGFAPSHNFSLGACNALQPSLLLYQEGFSHLGQLPRAQNLVSYRPSDASVSPFYAVGCNQTPSDAVYMQWPTPAMMYAHSFEHFTRASFQAPVYQQPLSFERWQNH